MTPPLEQQCSLRLTFPEHSYLTAIGAELDLAMPMPTQENGFGFADHLAETLPVDGLSAGRVVLFVSQYLDEAAIDEDAPAAARAFVAELAQELRAAVWELTAAARALDGMPSLVRGRLMDGGASDER